MFCLWLNYAVFFSLSWLQLLRNTILKVHFLNPKQGAKKLCRMLSNHWLKYPSLIFHFVPNFLKLCLQLNIMPLVDLIMRKICTHLNKFGEISFHFKKTQTLKKCLAGSCATKTLKCKKSVFKPHPSIIQKIFKKKNLPNWIHYSANQWLAKLNEILVVPKMVTNAAGATWGELRELLPLNKIWSARHSYHTVHSDLTENKNVHCRTITSNSQEMI